MDAQSSDKLDLDADVIPLLHRWRAVKAWGKITIHFKGGAAVAIQPLPYITSPRDNLTHYPRRPAEMEPQEA